MTAHVHAEAMALYAQDAAETDKPWERWEYCMRNDCIWINCSSGGVAWNKNAQYRRKQKTIPINGFEVPEPCRDPLEIGEIYYSYSLYVDGAAPYTWGNSYQDKSLLAYGLIHKTKEAADIHAKALTSFTVRKS